MHITDPDVKLLVNLAETIKKDYIDEDNAWKDSPFEWIKSKSSRQIGKIGEQLISDWCKAKGFDVARPHDSEADRIISGWRFEIKFSTLWKQGVFKFQQIRDQNYDFLICLGLEPFNAKCWLIPKKTLYEHVIGHTPQHKGQAGTDTYWLSFPADSPPKWLNECGGTLHAVYNLLKSIGTK